MEIIIYNIRWMTFNIFLAILPIFFGVFMSKASSGVVRFLLFIFWLLFIPNTIYLLTDPINIIGDAKRLQGIYLFYDSLLYVVLIPIGIITYILSMYYFEKMFQRLGRAKSIPIFVVNVLIGLGIVLGRVPRVNSWDALLNIDNVAMHVLTILRAPEFLVAVITCSVICHLIYLKFKKPVLARLKII